MEKTVIGAQLAASPEMSTPQRAHPPLPLSIRPPPHPRAIACQRGGAGQQVKIFGDAASCAPITKGGDEGGTGQQVKIFGEAASCAPITEMAMGGWAGWGVKIFGEAASCAPIIIVQGGM